MSAHTPGRLVAVPCTDNPGANLVHEHVSGELRFIAHVSIPADARRLAACWNACEGMETHDIEALSTLGNVGDMFRSLHQQIGSVKADLMRSDIKLAAARAERDQARDDLLAVRDESRAIEASYEAARALLAEFEQRIATFLKAPK